MHPRPGRELCLRRRRSAVPALPAHHISSCNRRERHAVSERNVDFLIARRFGHVADDRFSVEMLYDDSWVVVAGAQNPWVRRRRIELAELVSEPWALGPPESVAGWIAMEAFRAIGL